MEKLNKYLILIIVTTLILSVFNISFVQATTSSAKLHTLGLLEDISRESLDEDLSRMIGLTMILKSLGYTDKSVSERAYTCPFTDVPDWFKGWATVAVDLSITDRVSVSRFDPNGALTQKMFYVLQLIALGYGIDETWNNTEMLAINAGLIKNGVTLNSKSFTKRDASEVML